MTTSAIESSPHTYARIAGIAYLLIFIAGIGANFAILEQLIVPGDAAATSSAIIANMMQFRIGILGFVVMVAADVVVAWALYVLLKQSYRNLSLLAAWLRLVNCAVFGVALYHLFGVLHLLGGAGYLSAMTTEELQMQVMLMLKAFDHTWLVGLVFFSLHLAALGYMVVRSGSIPRAIGILLIVASVGYFVDSCAHFLMPDYADYETLFALIVIVPGVVGELSLTLWLLIKGAASRTWGSPAIVSP